MNMPRGRSTNTGKKPESALKARRPKSRSGGADSGRKATSASSPSASTQTTDTALLSREDVFPGELPPEFDAITPKQRLFVVFYAITRKGVEAARMAGYTGDYGTLAVTSADNLRNPKILKAYDSYMKPQFDQHGITIANILQELASIGFSDIGDILDFSGETPKMRRASEITALARRSIQSMKVKKYVEGGEDGREVEIIEFRFWNKNHAIETLAKMLRMIGRSDEEERQNIIDQSRHIHVHQNGTADEARKSLLALLQSK